MLTKEQKSRYERSLLADGFSEEAQQRLSDTHIAVVGAGGLGSAALYYLTAAGAGRITIIENDDIAISNLQRQILYSTPQVGRPKATEAAQRLSQLNPLVDFTVITEKLTEKNAEALLKGCHVVIDCTDNYRTRYIIDDFCSRAGAPMIYGTAQDTRGQVAVFDFGGGPSYRDLYPEEPEQAETVGILPPVAGIVGTIQAMEAIKVVCGIGKTLSGQILTFDALNTDINIFNIG